MAARSIASLTLSFGLVSIPVKLYSATETASAVKFSLLARDGSRLKQQYVSEKDQTVVARADMVKGYEFEKDKFVLFTPEELKALEEASSPTIEIMAFIPEKSVDPLYYDKAYLLAPDKRGGKPYAIPESMEALTFIYNKKLISADQLPKTTDDLIAQAKTYNGPDKYLFVYNASREAYFSAPWWQGAGVTLVTPEGTTELNSENGIKAAELIQSFNQIMPKESDYGVADFGDAAARAVGGEMYLHPS